MSPSISRCDRSSNELGREIGPELGSAAEWLMTRVGVDRLAALHLVFELVRRGGTVSIVGLYGGMTDPCR